MKNIQYTIRQDKPRIHRNANRNLTVHYHGLSWWGGGGLGVHSKITGKQKSLYSAWKGANPTKTMSLDYMVKIEIQAMKEAGIPEDVATGWVVKALEDLKSQGVKKLVNRPWGSVNP